MIDTITTLAEFPHYFLWQYDWYHNHPGRVPALLSVAVWHHNHPGGVSALLSVAVWHHNHTGSFCSTICTNLRCHNQPCRALHSTFCANRGPTAELAELLFCFLVLAMLTSTGSWMADQHNYCSSGSNLINHRLFSPPWPEATSVHTIIQLHRF